MTKIAFLGLGQMGTPMATRLLEAGHDLTVWNRTPERAQPLREAGASVAGTPAEAGRAADVAITMVTDPEALERVVFGPDGLADALGPGRLLLEMSTVGPDEVRSIAERLPDGVEVVDSPVMGSVPQATAGELNVLAGGSEGAFERVRPILETFGNVRHVGALGSGAAMKLVVNSTLGAAITAVGEAIALADALGLDRGATLDVLAGSQLGAAVSAKRESIESGSYPPRFKLSLAAKDLRLVTDAAARVGRELPVANAASGWLEQAIEAGAGDLDYSAVVATIVGEEIEPIAE
jgi:3-hydroxyisobutyrate dehydrogenase-like beta-hydroxyacid dehydrogenase